MIYVVVIRTVMDFGVAVGVGWRGDWRMALLWAGFFVADLGTIALMTIKR